MTEKKVSLETKKLFYDRLRPWFLAASIALLAYGVGAAAFDLAVDQVIEAYRRDSKRTKSKKIR
ncbi:hypothetical protein A2774_01370 [Candidatus Roizmanbacteria bacterium RIFCSPHIGHO2_01_FULL_39_12c]|uniref:Uncharacterized protein n=1 Tax=Candidatus Roizmanbacteria bacterium RIFCSPHIGHO2_01_FULL_39_12c TaxID=1802031 RepID=A0A1F7GDV0_9BACT|nr:MAG: hypothetical protein A2774_01370 [Candidatus Roizmanbacteria bacterium RIFCSPHIGHO2_01_FULL_39_12c]OGK47523.1 MAG: hypothetical protein A2963_01375 [Candidatus Roizmanbacteria bacterium RIFCSPLOWO2_01_FULL_40_13]